MHELPPDFIRAQLDAVFDDIGVDAAKTGMLFSRPIIETVAEFLERQPVPLVVDPVLIASSGAQLLQDDAVETLIGRLFPLATVVTPNLPEAEALTGLRGASRRELAERLVELGAAAALVTGGHGETAVDHLFDGREHIEIPVERHAVAATHGAGCTHSATLAALLARGLPLVEAARGAAAAASAAVRNGLVEIGARRRPGRRPQPERHRMSIDPGATLGVIRERKPLVHNITNYVVMNETANAILALGALPVMAHAKDEVREMVGLAGALVLNIGTLSEDWIEAMLLAGAAANERGIPVVLDPVGAGATALPDEDREADPRRGRRDRAARERGRGRDARRRRGRGARRRVGRRRRRPGRARARGRDDARRRRVGHRPGRPRLRRRARSRRSRTATSCSRRSPARAACRRR